MTSFMEFTRRWAWNIARTCRPARNMSCFGRVPYVGGRQPIVDQSTGAATANMFTHNSSQLADCPILSQSLGTENDCWIVQGDLCWLLTPLNAPSVFQQQVGEIGPVGPKGKRTMLCCWKKSYSCNLILYSFLTFLPGHFIVRPSQFTIVRWVREFNFTFAQACTLKNKCCP